MKKHLACILLLATTFTLFGSTIHLVKDSVATGKIILQPEASPSEQLAAKELQDYVQKISGAVLPIQAEPEANCIILGTIKNLAELPADIRLRLENDRSDEAFHIKTIGDKVYIVGKAPIGILYGAYTFLEALGVRWLYPGPQGEVCPQQQSIAITDMDDFQSPSMPYRSVCFTGASYNMAEAAIWMARNKMTQYAFTQPFRLYDKCTQEEADFFNAARNFPKAIGGHSAFQLTIPVKKYFQEHPEYFPLIKGERVCEGRVQRCLSHPEVQKIYEDAVYQYTLDGYHFFFGAEDRGNTFCQCDECQKMGTVNGEYNTSNLVHRFFSLIAARVSQRNPSAKYFMHIYNDYRKMPTAADVKYPPEVLGLYCSHQRCYVHEFNDPKCLSNAAQYAEFKDWMKICPNVALRDYIQISHCDYAPFEYVVAKDIRHLAEIGVAGWTDECPPPYGRIGKQFLERNPFLGDKWFNTWPTYYVAAKVSWNSEIDADKLMHEAYTKYYGVAAKPMLEYHALRRKLWENAPGHAFYGGPKRTAYCLTVPQSYSQLTALLEEAKKAAEGDEMLAKRVQMDETFLNRYWKDEADKMKSLFSAERQIIPQPVTEKITIDAKLDEGSYVSARPVDGFLSLRTGEAPIEPTSVRVLYDDDNLYFGIVAQAEKSWGPAKADAGHDGAVWGDDSVELQIAPPDSNGDFYHIIVNTNGVVYDSKMNGSHIDKSFDAQAEVKVEKDGNLHNYEIRLPLAPMQTRIIPGQTWRMHFIRNCRSLQPPLTSETSTIDRVNPHQLSNFRQVFFGKNIIKNGNFGVLEEYEKDIDGLVDRMFPKHWGIVANYCRIDKSEAGGNLVTFRTGTIYTYLGIFSKTEDGKVTVDVEASGKGKISAVFWTWFPDKKVHNVRLQQKKSQPKNTTSRKPSRHIPSSTISAKIRRGISISTSVAAT